MDTKHSKYNLNSDWLIRAAIRLFPPLEIGNKVIIQGISDSVFNVEKVREDGSYMLDTWIDKPIDRDRLILYNDSDPKYNIGQVVKITDPMIDTVFTATINNIISVGTKPTIQYIYEFNEIKGQFHENYIVSVEVDTLYNVGDSVEIIDGSYKGTKTVITKVYDDHTYDVECIPNEIHLGQNTLKPIINEINKFSIGEEVLYNGKLDQIYTIEGFKTSYDGIHQALIFNDHGISCGYVNINTLSKTNFYKEYKVGDYLQFKQQCNPVNHVFVITKIYPDDIHMDIKYVMTGDDILFALKENFIYAKDFDESTFKYTSNNIVK